MCTHTYIKEYFCFPTHMDLPPGAEKGSVLFFLSSKHWFSLIFNKFLFLIYVAFVCQAAQKHIYTFDLSEDMRKVLGPLIKPR